ncbi:iron-containing alcohol dehydrogenase [Nitratireductor mangrovi]|uniref:Iron-containing alcohol dehydrogenase n=1 Tax=Nitratireductor mangrovi TaxID=2599600 RepID=A0A5B8KYL1_9HYPH|nr:iron-containing alcohol dehydrogenase [Nitratireductor mangrovi]QDZ00558.1 iron-containing alcohol dehydrogenase [Nitratireductor mangrovi]
MTIHAQAAVLRPPATASLRFGSVAQVLPSIAAEERAYRVAIVSSPSQTNSVLLGSAAAALGATLAGSFPIVRAHSPYDDLVRLVSLLKQADADLIVAIGGGSVIDACKVAQIGLRHGLDDAEAFQAFRTAPPGRPDPAAGIRVVAVPTTLSSAEFTPFAGITDSATGRKDAYDHPLMVPKHVVFDAEALLATPVSIVAASGSRAIDHCVETLCSTAAEAYHGALALAGLKLLWRGLPILAAGKASADDARDLLRASWMAISGPAAGIPVGASHAIGRVVGAVSGVQHGHTSAILLQRVLEWNAELDACRERQEWICRELDLPNADLGGAVRHLFDACAQPSRLSEAGVARADLPKIAAFSVTMLRHPSVAGNARPIATEAEVMEILERAW